MNTFRNWKFETGAAFLCIIVACGYILTAAVKYRIGFPLDDAWIHQTFARNLIQFGEWSFNPGYPAAGSTAPLWTLLLSVSFILRASPIIWSYILGIMIFGLLAICVVSIVNTNNIRRNRQVLFIGLIIVATEWHLAWATVSGMETILFSLMVIVSFWLLSQKTLQPVFIGTLIGMSVWVRPEGITLLGPTILVISYQFYGKKPELVRSFIKLILPLILLLIPYLSFNYLISGNVWPNTLIAKQLEYASFKEINFFTRYIKLFFTPMVGGNLLLLPGFFYTIYVSIWSKRMTNVSIVLWIFGFLLMYAVKLPVTYQHGRYLIPIIPAYLSLAIPGMFQLIEKIITSKIGWMFGQVWLISVILVSIGFNVLGARAYASDVAIIETEMVETSKWIDVNTPADSVIAAHDIGALGFFGNRKVIDLAGLVNPDVVEYVTDPIELRKYIHDSEIDYLMTFPNWYKPPILDEKNSVYKSPYFYAKAEGGESMEVYIIDTSNH